MKTERERILEYKQVRCSNYQQCRRVYNSTTRLSLQCNIIQCWLIQQCYYTNDAWWRVWHANIHVPKLRCQHECWYFNFGTCILACHTSPSCVICFVASQTEIWWNIIKTYILLARNDTIRQLRHDIITSRHEWSHAHRGASANEHVSSFVYI